MHNSIKIFLALILLTGGLTILAQEMLPVGETPDIGAGYSPVVTEEAVNLDENIQPEDLEVREPRVLPDSPFYFLKNWARGIQSFFTFDPAKRAELRLKIANEKLMEVKKLVQKTEDPEIIKKATENYQQEIEKIKDRVEKIKEKAKENPQVERFLDKFIHQQTLHQKLLQRLETQVPPEAFEKIKEARERHLERFKDVLLKLEDRAEKITEKLDEILEKQKGSQFKEFKNLEILKELEEKVPEEAKEAIKKAQENALKRLQGNLEKMPPETQEKFQEYIEKISGERKIHFEILENLKSATEEMSETVRKAKVKVGESIQERLRRLNCPPLVLLPPEFCPEGKVVSLKEDEKGCYLPICIEPILPEHLKPILPEKPEAEKPEVCITLWDPVCGKDGKTYSNSCFAKAAGVEIAHKGVCGEYEYYIHGTFTREANDEDIKDFQKQVEVFQAEVVSLESFPMQFQIYPLTSESCSKVKEILGTLKYVQSFADCRLRPIQPGPGAEEPVGKELLP